MIAYEVSLRKVPSWNKTARFCLVWLSAALVLGGFGAASITTGIPVWLSGYLLVQSCSGLTLGRAVVSSVFGKLDSMGLLTMPDLILLRDYTNVRQQN